MKKIINYTKDLRFKIANDEMSRTEALTLFVLLIGFVAWAIHVLDPILKIR